MIGTYITNIEEETIQNQHYRRVIDTGKYMQLVVMSLRPGEEIGTEVHSKTDQFIRVEKGKAAAIVDGKRYRLGKDNIIVIKAGSSHNIINIGRSTLKIYTIYSRVMHKKRCLQKTKQDPEC